MEPNKKEMYCSPDAKTFEVKIEGVICLSGLDDPTDYIPGEDPFNPIIP